MILGRQYQVFKRDRLKYPHAGDMSIRKWDGTKYTTLSTSTRHGIQSATTSNGLEECLSIIPKNICNTRTKGKLIETKEESTKERFLRNNNACSQVQTKGRTFPLSPRYTEEGQLADVKEISTTRSKKQAEWKVNFNDEYKTSTRKMLIQKQTKLCVTKTADLLHKQTEVGTTITTHRVLKQEEVGTSKTTMLIQKQAEVGATVTTDRIQKQAEVGATLTTHRIQKQLEACAKNTTDPIQKQAEAGGIITPHLDQKQAEVGGIITPHLDQKQAEVGATITTDRIQKQAEVGGIITPYLDQKQAEVGGIITPYLDQKQAEVGATKTTDLIEKETEVFATKTKSLIQKQTEVYAPKNVDVIQPQTGVCATKFVENDTEHNCRLSTNHTSLHRMSDKANYTDLKTHNVPALEAKSLKGPNVETHMKLPTPVTIQRNNTTRSLLSHKATASLFPNTVKSSNINSSNHMFIYTSRRKTSGPGFRCKTSVGHYRPTTPEQRETRLTKSAGFLRYRQRSDEVGNILADSYISDLACRLEVFVTENNIHKFQSMLFSWHPGTRQKVINYKATCNHSSSVFFRACQLSRIAIVTLMLKECVVDLEQSGIFNVPDDETVFQVTPLWNAAASRNLDLVKLLISFGANINATSATGCSVVRAACCVSSVPIVSYLISQGADIHTQNQYGVTCLMSGIMNTEVIKLLILNRSKINEVDNQGNTALHYAAEAGRIDTVKLLIEVGVNPIRTNNERCHAIQIAATHGQAEVVDYLLRVATPSVDEVVDVFMVLGSVCIIMDNEYSSGYVYWQKAFELKRLSRKVSLTRCRPLVLTDVVDIQELTTIEELSRLCYDHEALCMQALLIYERTRGSLDENFLNLLMYRGAVSADNQNLTLAINLWKTAYKLRLHKYINVSVGSKRMDMFNRSIINTVRYLLKIFHDISQERIKSSGYDTHSHNQMSISEDVIRDLFQLLCYHVIQGNIALKENKNESHKFLEAFTFLLKACLIMFYVFLTRFCSTGRSTELATHLQKLIRLNPRGLHNETLLHMCLDCQLLQSYYLETKELTHKKWPSFVMLEILLVLGADPLARDSRGNTILHLVVHLHKQGLTLDPSHAKRLLSLGVHPDQLNRQAQTAFDLLPPGDDLRQMLQQPNLKCLAARAIVSYKISYIGEVPKCLYPFIEMHSC